jgi:hypothetical protein
LPVDPFAEDWGAIVAAVCAQGPTPWHEPVADAFLAAVPDSDSEKGGGWPPAGLLDVTAPGPLLAGLVAALDTETCSDAELVAGVAAAYRLQSWAAAVEVETTNRLVRRCEGWRGVVPRGRQVSSESVSAELMASVEVGCALDLAPRTAQGRVALAGDLQRLPATRAALAAGSVDVPKARMLVEELRPLADEPAQQVEARIVAAAAGRTRSQLAARVRRAVLAVRPEQAQERHRRSVADRNVGFFPLTDGMAGMSWIDSAERVEAFRLWLEGLAARAKGPVGADDRTMDQVRADVLADLAEHALASQDLPVRQGRRPQVQVVVAWTTLVGLDELPGELVGYGPVTAQTARRIAADATWRRLLVEPRTGRFDELSVDTYQPPQDIVDHVIARDRTCRTPGCRTAGHRCDLDHRDPYPRGPTSAGNLDVECRAHHMVKTHTDTVVVADGDGGLRFTLPSARSYTRPGEPVLEDPFTDVPPF